jgi:hypothetical protein
MSLVRRGGIILICKTTFTHEIWWAIGSLSGKLAVVAIVLMIPRLARRVCLSTSVAQTCNMFIHPFCKTYIRQFRSYIPKYLLKWAVYYMYLRWHRTLHTQQTLCHECYFGFLHLKTAGKYSFNQESSTAYRIRRLRNIRVCHQTFFPPKTDGG